MTQSSPLFLFSTQSSLAPSFSFSTAWSTTVLFPSICHSFSLRFTLSFSCLMFLFWFLVVLSVYFEIFCNKICLDAMKIAEKMWKICRKIAFLECYPTPKIVFRLFSIAQPNTRISFSLREFTFPCIHFTLRIRFTLNQTLPK